ncbi:phage terminase large subunit [Candidatus Pacearchaeota archaeon]|nr:phage terminase large subunit [Candidatus Pacearchaeota archaeon]
MSSALARRLDALEPLVKARAGKLEKSVYGVVDKVIDGKPNIIRRWKGTIGDMEPTDEDPTILLIEKLEPCILKHKKYKCLFGGRAGTKSIFGMSAMVGDVNSCGSKVYVLRERMKSLKESIYSGIEETINELGMKGFNSISSQWEIRHRSGGKLTFGGMQNVIDMKGSFKYKYFFMEEAARTKQSTIDILGPTLRGVDNAELWYVWNPEGANDPMSLEFIIPYQAELDKYGYYEDDYHLIIKVGFEDNPWFFHDKSLRDEYSKDKDKVEKGLMSKARFRHIWHGDFNDDIANSIIETDWFDACIDAHKKLGFEGVGARFSACDPSDVGNDPTGYVSRKGVVIDDVREIPGQNGNVKFDESCKLANLASTDVFGWDCDGMGALLRNQASVNFQGKKVHAFMYKGSESPHLPEAKANDAHLFDIQDTKKNKDVYRNKRAQNITALAARMWRTYDAVVNRNYHDPAQLISFDSDKIDTVMMSKLRSECCKMPIRPSDRIEFYSKKDMQTGIVQPDGSRIKIPSPNLFDALVISFDRGGIINRNMVDTTSRPGTITPMGKNNARSRRN